MIAMKNSKTTKVNLRDAQTMMITEEPIFETTAANRL